MKNSKGLISDAVNALNYGNIIEATKILNRIIEIDEKNIRINGEFYVCPVYNEAILDGKKIRVKKIEKMWGIGTPEDLAYFLENNK